MNKALAFLLCLSIPASCAAASTPTTLHTVKMGPDLKLEPKAGLPEQSLHFTVEAYGTTASNKASLLETAYSAFFDATGVTSFEMPQKIRVVIFENRKEFRTKIGGRSRNSVTEGNTLATFEQANLNHILVANVSNMMLEAYLGRKLEDDTNWVRQGVMGTVSVLTGDEDPGDVRERWRAYLKRAHPVSLDELTKKSRIAVDEDPTAETVFERRKNERSDRANRPVKRMQMSASSLVLFMRDWGGQLNFSFFLSQLRANKRLDDAVALAYPGKFRNMSELYNFWLHDDVGELKTPDPTQK